MNFLKRLKIGTKIIILSSFLAALFLGLSLFLFLSDVKAIFSDSFIKDYHNDVEIHSDEFSLFLRNVISDIKLIKENHALKMLLDYDKDISKRDNFVDAFEMTESVFLEVSSSRKIYGQIRYINENGYEIVRVNYVDGKSIVVEENDLQDKSNRNYFIEANKLNEGELYISNTDLNREGNPPEIEIPYKPVVRYAMPVFNEKKERKGVVVLNVLVSNLSDLITKRFDNEGDFFITDDEGYYIFFDGISKDDKRFGSPNDLNTGENIQKDLPIIYEEISHKDSGFGILDGQIYAFSKIYLNGLDDDTGRYWIFLKMIPTSEAFSVIKMIGRDALIIGISIFFLLFFTFYFAVKNVLKPLKDLEVAANQIKKGNFSQSIDVKNFDEIGVVAKTFNDMSKELAVLYSSMEERVKQKTNEVSEKLKDLENARTATLNVLEDVEEEKIKSDEEREKIKTIVESIGDGVFVADRNSNIVMFNEAAEKMSGFSKDEAVGKKYREVLRFISEKDGSFQDEFIDNVIKNGMVDKMEGGTLLVKKQGGTIPVNESAAPLKNKENSVIGCVVVFRDITKEKEVDRAKTEFVSLASHQLRTPLTAINWYAEMLLSGDAGELNTDQKEFINQIYSGNQRMVDLVSALLNVSRIDLGTFAIDPQPVNFVEILDNVIDELKPLIESKKIKVEKIYENIPVINADKNLTRIIFQNLISNAVKYTPENGNVWISMKLERDDVLISVRDNGFGIPKGQQSKIFEKLFRADNVQNKEVEGTGLGLYIVKAIIEQSGGKIWFDSEENKGTAFFVTVPLTGMAKKTGTKGLS